MIILFSLPRGTLLFAMLLACVVVFCHAVGAGEFGDAAKAVIMGSIFAVLLTIRLRA